MRIMGHALRIIMVAIYLIILLEIIVDDIYRYVKIFVY
jgi:hypothetical protein